MLGLLAGDRLDGASASLLFVGYLRRNDVLQHDVPTVSVVGSAHASTPALSVFLPARRRRGAQCLSSERAPIRRGTAFEQHHERAGGLEIGRLRNVFHRVSTSVSQIIIKHVAPTPLRAVPTTAHPYL